MEQNSSFGQGSQTISQDELVGTVQMTQAFRCISYEVQPGLSENYPWLSQVASLYQKYVIEDMVYYYKPLVSQYAPLGQQGRIVLSFDTDAAASPLTSLQQAEGMSPHSDGIPFERINLRLPKRASAPLYVRNATPPYGTDVKTYDAGKLFLCTEGGKSDEMSGELRVKYVVRLLLPVIAGTGLVPTPASGINYSVLHLINDVTLNSGPANVVGAIDWYSGLNGLNFTLDEDGSIGFLPGQYHIIAQFFYTGAGTGADRLEAIVERDLTNHWAGTTKTQRFNMVKPKAAPSWTAFGGSQQIMTSPTENLMGRTITINCVVNCTYPYTYFRLLAGAGKTSESPAATMTQIVCYIVPV